MISKSYDEFMKEVVVEFETFFGAKNGWVEWPMVEDSKGKPVHYDFIRSINRSMSDVFDSYIPSKYYACKDSIDFSFDNFEDAELFAETVMKYTKMFIGYWIILPEEHFNNDFQHVSRIYLYIKDQKYDFKKDKVIN